MEIASRIREYIMEEFADAEGIASLQYDTPLLGRGIDSLGLMGLISFIEEEFDITLEYEDLTVEHFRTIADMEHLILEKQGETVQAG